MGRIQTSLRDVFIVIRRLPALKGRPNSMAATRPQIPLAVSSATSEFRLKSAATMCPPSVSPGIRRAQIPRYLSPQSMSRRGSNLDTPIEIFVLEILYEFAFGGVQGFISQRNYGKGTGSEKTILPVSRSLILTQIVFGFSSVDAALR